VLFVLNIVGVAASNDASYAPDAPEPGSVEAIRDYTTSDEFLSAAVSYVPESDTVPSPADVLGHHIGAPDELSRVADIHGYFRKLAEASRRVHVRTIGTSEEGREILLAAIADEATLDHLERYMHITNRLADPRRVAGDEARRLASDGKVIYYLLGGLHSPETGSPEMLMELAYRLAVSERSEIRDIRENVIVLITPVCEPDGRDRQVDWFYRHLRGRDLSWRELRRFGSPPYWGHYVYHDNNRDGMQLTLALTRAVHETYYEFNPQVVHDLHESLPLLYISTGHGPYSNAIDPVTINEWTQFAHHEASQLQAAGLPGVWVWGFWDGWWPGYLFSVANNHNSIGRFYETFGNSAAGTFERDLEERRFVGEPVTKREWYRPWPPDKKVEWSLRNNTNYMQSGVLQALHYAARHRSELLLNFWAKTERAIAKGGSEAPYAWIFPRAQRDPRRLDHVVNLMRQHRFEVHQLDEPFELGETSYPAGSIVVRLDQPYRNAIVNFLEVQKFPPDEKNQPYDDIAWTWPLLHGVDAARVVEASILEAPMRALREPLRTAGHVNGKGRVWLLADQGQTSLLAARVGLGRANVEAAEEAFEVAGVQYPVGSWIVTGSVRAVESVAADHGLDFAAAERAPDVARHAVDLPRLAVLHTWTATQDCGWVRYALDQEAIPYTLISPDDVKRGNLESRFDVILFPNTWGNFARIVHGRDPAYGPLAYTRTDAYPSHGSPNGSPDVTGGMGFAGLEHIDDFVRSGGVLVAMGNAGRLPVEGGMTRNVSTADVGRTPGSELRAKVLQVGHPIVYGYEELTSVFRGNMALFDVDKLERDLVVMQFGTKKVDDDESEDAEESQADDDSGAEKAAKQKEAPLVLSGFVKEPKRLDGKPAILDVPVGAGHVVLFSFNPMHRYLNLSDFRLVYNVVLNWNDLPQRRGVAAPVQAVSRKRSN
jgi:hypothetical protein